MERELWPRLYHLVMEVGRDLRVKGVSFQPHIVLLVLLWATLHDRPRSWACDPANWATTSLRPARIPSESVLSRRLRRLSTHLLMRMLAERARDAGDPSLIHVIDGKPLLVGGASTDPEARCGRGAGMRAKGYKLHATWAGRPFPGAYRVEPLNANECKVAEEMVGDLAGGGYLLGDGEYDANGVFDAAGAAGFRLVAPREDPDAGLGHRYQSPYRLRSIELLRGRFGREVYALRGRVERVYGNLSAFGGGLTAPPSWVRRTHRVRPWVWAKLMINAMRILEKQRLTA
jgi:Transposase DDE domain